MPTHRARAHFVGLSLGGMTGLRLAARNPDRPARNPDRIDRLVVLCTGAQLESVQSWTDRAATVRAHGTGAIAEAVVRRWFRSPAAQGM